MQQIHQSTVIQLHILISKEDDEEQFSVVALNLPGCASCGESEVEAIENIKEAANGLIESYRESGTEIPWLDTFSQDIPGAKVVLLDA